MLKNVPVWLLSVAMLSAPSAAHERWVLHDLLDPNFDRSLFTSFTPLNTAAMVGLVLVIAALWALSKRIRSDNPIPGTSSPMARDLATLFLGVTYGVTCVITSFNGEYLAPDLIGMGPMGNVLVWGTAGFGFLLMIGLFTRFACLGTIALFVLALALRPFADFDGQSVPAYAVFNYVDIVGIALFLAVAGRGKYSVDAWRSSLQSQPRQPDVQHETAAGLLRILLGATLVVLGAQKFLLPELPMGVIQNYADLIFEPISNLTGVSEEQYVFGAATVEFSIGCLLILGLFTRFLMLALAGMFTSTLFIFEGEVIGHLPLFGVVVALFIAGGGRFRVGMPAIGGSLKTVSVLLACLLVPGLGSCGGKPVLASSSMKPAPVTRQGDLLTVRLTSETYSFDLNFQQPKISKLFSVETNVSITSTGEATAGGVLRLDASMPEHGHGMQTQPRTKRIGPQTFSTGGMKLHMNGSWELSVKFELNGTTETAFGRFDFGPPIRPLTPITK